MTADIEKALARADPELGRAIAVVTARIGRQRISPSQTAPFESLVRAIVHQSVSGKAAATTFSRLREAFVGALTPSKILAKDDGFLATVGLSGTKTHTIRSLAEWFVANPETAKTLPEASSDDVIAALTGIAGIGTWTVNVFLIFDLGRPDIMPAGDLGIRRGVQLVYGLEHVATQQQVREKAQLWRPYRSIASIYLWNAVKLKLTESDLSR